MVNRATILKMMHKDTTLAERKRYAFVCAILVLIVFSLGIRHYRAYRMMVTDNAEKSKQLKEANQKYQALINNHSDPAGLGASTPEQMKTHYYRQKAIFSYAQGNVGLSRYLTSAVARGDTLVESITFDAVKDDAVFAQGFQIVLDGSYADVLDYVRYVEKAPMLIVIDQIALHSTTSATNQTVIRGTVHATWYGIMQSL